MFTSITILWFVIGLAVAIGCILLVQWLRRNNLSVTWYEWLLGLIGLVLFLFSVQNFYSSFMEAESQAAWMFLVFPGLLGLLLIGIVYGLVVRRRRAA